MKLDLKQTLKAFDGQVLKDSSGTELTLGIVLSNIVLADKTEGKMRLYNLAQKLYSEKEVTLETPDLALVKKAVQENPNYTALVLGQVETILTK